MKNHQAIPQKEKKFPLVQEEDLLNLAVPIVTDEEKKNQ